MSTLKEYLELAKVRQGALAHKLGISPSYMSELMSGQRTPGLKMAVKIERLTGGAVPAKSWVSDDMDAEQDRGAA